MLSDSALLHNYVYCYSFGSAGYFSVYQRSIAIYTECLRKRGFDDKRLEKLNEILAKAGLLFSTNDSIVLTKELLAFLFDDSNGDDGGNTSGNPEDSDDEANGDAGGNTSGNPEDSDDEANGDAGGNTSGNPEDSDDEANGGAGGSSNSESNNKSKQFDSSQAAKDLTEDSSLDAGKVLGDLLSTNESNSQEIYHLPAMPTLANISGNPTLRDGELIMSEAMKANASLRRFLHGLVQAKYAKKVGNGRKGKRLTQNAMAKLTRNDYKVFRTSKEVECESTHFHILIDSSGSMQGHRIDNTMASTMAIIESLKAFTHVKTSVYAFGYDHTTDVALIKTPEQSQKQCLDNLTRLPTRGRTPLASALMATLVKASVSGDSRNVIILLTDGLPDTPYVAKQVIQSIHEEKQIELYSLMMGKPSNGEEIFGDNYSILETMADLPNAVFEIAKKSA